MRVLEGIPGDGTAKGPSAVTIGVFDGLHLGHQALLRRCRAEAFALGGEAIVITFKDHPDQLLRGEAPPRLMTEEDQDRGFASEGMDLVVRIPFDEETRNLRVESFSRDLLVEALGCRTLVLGFDSAICKDREGTLEAFQALGARLGFRALRVAPVLMEGELVSSSAIRKLLREGKIEEANKFLGRPWGFEGVVQAGNRLGHKLGFPTANISPPHILLPPLGVYTAWVRIQGKKHPAVVNLGVRPTLASTQPSDEDGSPSKRPQGGTQEVQPLCEAHILDQDMELEGKTLRLEFLAFLRPERRFPSLDALREAIARDRLRAQDFFCRALP